MLQHVAAELAEPLNMSCRTMIKLQHTAAHEESSNGALWNTDLHCQVGNHTVTTMSEASRKRLTPFRPKQP